MDGVIKLEKLTKRFGTSRGIVDVDLEVDKGSIFGFLGPNGAGKTTTIRVILDQLRPTSGTATVLGKDSVRDGVWIRRHVGYLSGDMELDGHLTGAQYLEYMMHVRGKDCRAQVKVLQKRLQADLNKKIRALSRGNKQKVGLIAALMSEPELLILDEPTSGLDPLMQAEFNELMREHKSKGNTVFVSSHVLSEVQQICDKVAFIRDGRIMAVRDLSDIAHSALRQVTVTMQKGLKGLESSVRVVNGVSDIERGEHQLHFHVQGDINPILSLIAKHRVDDIRIQEADLETVFMQYYSREENHVS